MSKRVRVSMKAIVGCLGVFLATPTMARSPAPVANQYVMSVHHQRMIKIMEDMTQEMNAMTEQMSRGELTPDQRKQMSRRMEMMSDMMHRMSSLEAMPAMNTAEIQKQMDDMREQMDNMMGAASMKPGK